MKLSSFSGMAQVTGQSREVHYDGHVFSIAVADAEEAQRILAILDTGASPLNEKPSEAGPPTHPAITALNAVTPLRDSPVALVQEPPEPGSDIDDFPPKESAPLAAAPTDENGLPQRVVESKRFIEVMTYVMEKHGLKGDNKAAIVAACEALKEHVPVVRRTRDIGEKVEMNLLTLAEAGRA